MAERQGSQVQQVCNQKETTWYENHVVRFKLRQRIQSRVRDKQQIRGVSDVSDDTASKWMQALALPGSRKKLWDKKKSLLWKYVYLSNNNKLWAPFENKVRDIYL